ncbi:RNase adapter RapZ [Butyricicoccus faecihominis]|uniref:RNase adapter RapZ n=1 Tax=Butyricicoccaceae TaxID=3085642 RepID=UPI002478A2F7|nr:MULTISPECIES: RNase adapter RapZ [Butyricicoccaceae]MCQ5130177.1 RNase adapter RapZ [Butyricicoccus faecihominis]WNX83100.1 RNase adapter RapZ [Agathobaculum sp. NTUH-O15-33]
MYFLIVSGMSGAGKSRAAASLEDLGYYCVDNLPIALIPRFAEICLAATERYERVALVTDVRTGGDFQQLFDSLDSIRDMGCEYRILFLDTDTQMLIRRFKETRRKHPLMDKGISMTAAIEKEREMLSVLRNRADFVVDTTNLSAAGLRERLLSLFSGADNMGALEVIVQSFGFKYGIPAESDLVFDVRFLPNPYYEMSLREKNGTDPDVRDYVFQGGTADALMSHLTSLIDFLLPRYVSEGKTSVVIGIGCTGGKHRSVAIAEALSNHIRGRDYGVVTMHRDYQR